MHVREDLRSKILPTLVENLGDYNHPEGFDTRDLVYIECYNSNFSNSLIEQKKENRVSATDYAIMNHANVRNDYTTRTGKDTTYTWLRTNVHCVSMEVIDHDGGWNYCFVERRDVGVRPSLHYYLPIDNSKQSFFQFLTGKRNKSKEIEELDIRAVKDQKR